MSPTSSTPYIDQADLAYGSKCITWAFNALAWGVTLAVTWSCSSILMGIIMFLITSVVMGILAGLINVVVQCKLDSTTVESIGRNVGGAAARITSLFSRKVTA